MSTGKRRGGRPSAYRPEFCRYVVMMGHMGLPLKEMAFRLGVDPSTFWRWRERHPKFGESVEFALEASEAYFFRVGRENLFAGSAFNQQAFIHLAANQHGWKRPGRASR